MQHALLSWDFFLGPHRSYWPTRFVCQCCRVPEELLSFTYRSLTKLNLINAPYVCYSERLVFDSFNHADQNLRYSLKTLERRTWRHRTVYGTVYAPGWWQARPVAGGGPCSSPASSTMQPWSGGRFHHKFMIIEVQGKRSPSSKSLIS